MSTSIGCRALNTSLPPAATIWPARARGAEFELLERLVRQRLDELSPGDPG